MATLKLKKTTARGGAQPHTDRAPVRGAGSAPRRRPTLSEAQALRAEREARYQEQLRQRFGDKQPAQFVHRDEPQRPPRPARDEPRPPQRPPRDERRPPQRQARPPPSRPA